MGGKYRHGASRFRRLGCPLGVPPLSAVDFDLHGVEFGFDPL
jgi:hypothetical protein